MWSNAPVAVAKDCAEKQPHAADSDVTEFPEYVGIEYTCRTSRKALSQLYKIQFFRRKKNNKF
jgi:hypothetical protein